MEAIYCEKATFGIFFAGGCDGRQEWQLALSGVRPRLKFGSRTMAVGDGRADRADLPRPFFSGGHRE